MALRHDIEVMPPSTGEAPPAAFTPRHPCGAPLLHPATPVQHPPQSRRAVLRRAAGRSGGRRRRAEGAASAAGEGVRPGWRRTKGFYSSYPSA
jgi:hypothetical protein